MTSYIEYNYTLYVEAIPLKQYSVYSLIIPQSVDTFNVCRFKEKYMDFKWAGIFYFKSNKVTDNVIIQHQTLHFSVMWEKPAITRNIHTIYMIYFQRIKIELFYLIQCSHSSPTLCKSNDAYQQIIPYLLQ